MIKFLLPASFLVLLFYNQSFGQYEGKLGINMGGIHANGYVDMVKAALPFDHGGTDSPLAGDELDENGWPKENFRFLLMDNRPVPEWAGTIDDPEKYRVNYGGTYSCSFTGLAQITNIGGPWHIENQQYDTTSNTTTFNLVIDEPGANHGLVIMNFDQTRRSAGDPVNTGIADLKIIRPGYEDRPGQVFTDQLFESLNSADFSVIREQGFTGTTSWPVEYPVEYEWTQRKLPEDPIQGSEFNGKLESAAWEHFIDLCNEVEMDIWLNVPISASADYIRNLAMLVGSRLDTTLNVYVENDNEVWNSAPGFIGTYNYNQDEATALGITPEENIARRAVELAQIFGEVFGAGEINNRIRVILASHAPMLKWWVEPMLSYIQETYGPPKNYIYSISRQTYFSSENAASNLTVDQIINELYDNIQFQLEDDPVNDAGRADWIRVAGDWDLPGGASSYEGGLHTPSGGGVNNLANQIQMHRSERMTSLFRYNIVNNWFDIGGGLAMHFTLVSGYNRYGCWGITDDLSNPDRNYKMEAFRNLQTVTGLDIPNEQNESLKLYPNPANESVLLEIPEQALFQLSIRSLSGKKMMEINRFTTGQTIHTGTLQPGLYLVTVRDNKTIYTSRLVIRR